MEKKTSLGKKISPRIKLKPFTPQSYRDVEARVKAEKEEALKRLVEKERLQRNRERGGKEKKSHPNPYLVQGKTLPSNFHVPKELRGKPLEDIDEFYKNKYTFIVVNRSKIIFRFSCKKAFFVFSPTNPIREKSVFVSTHPYFNWTMMLIILSNIVLITTRKFSDFSDFVYLGIYTTEIVLRMIARGLVIDGFSYARDPWLIFDLVVVTLGWILRLRPTNYESVRGFQVFRVFKMIVTIPGCRVIVFAFWNAVCHLRDIAIITFIIFSIYALLGYQLFHDVLRKRCVPENSTRPYSSESYLDENTTVANNWTLCRKGKCPNDFKCVDLNKLRDGDEKSFDNFWWSMLSVFRIVTQDHWEKLYNQVMLAFGPVSVFYFLSVMFIGTYFVLNLILGIVSMAFEESQHQENIDERYRLQDEANDRMRREEEEGEAGRKGEDGEDGSLPSLPSIAKSTESRDSTNKERTGLKGISHRLRSCLVDTCSRSYCPPCWGKISRAIEIFITDPFVELALTLCIASNTIVMALESDDEDINIQLDKLEKGFAILFICEAALKCLGLGCLRYFGDRWNRFDAVVVLLCVFDLAGLTDMSAFVILRSLRLLRVIKLAKSWRTLQRLLMIIRHTFKALTNLAIVLSMVIFIFASLGGQLFDEDDCDDDDDTRWHFRDIWHSLLTVFRIICGEWVELMWKCFSSCPSKIHICIGFYLVVVIVGNLFGLSLFLALLLNSFNAETLMGTQEDEDEDTKLQQAIDRIVRWSKYFSIHVKRHLSAIRCKQPLSSHKDPQSTHQQKTSAVGGAQEPKPLTTELRHSAAKEAFHLKTLDRRCHDDAVSYGYEEDATNHKTTTTTTTTKSKRLTDTGNEIAPAQEDGDENRKSVRRSLETVERDAGSEHRTANGRSTSGSDGHVRIIVGTFPADCLPKCAASPVLRYGCTWLLRSEVGRRWSLLRSYALQLVEHIFFQIFIVLLIVLSSLLLCLEDINLIEGSEFARYLELSDIIFAVIFSMEMLLMWLAFGMKAYFTSGWCCLDFAIVLISCQQAFLPEYPDDQYESLKSLRTLRALRPLRVVSRWEGMKLVVNALFQAIPSIFNVLLVCLLFWLIFAIAGVQLFRGRLGNCTAWKHHGHDHHYDYNTSGHPLVLMYYYNGTEEVSTTTATTATIRTVPAETAGNEAECQKWEANDVNFDNVINAYLALFQVATFEGWIEIMEGAADRQKRHGDKVIESNMMSFLYFIIFIILGSFLILNLFVGVLIDSVNELKRRAEGSLDFLMTESQKQYYRTMKRFALRNPANSVPKPNTAFQLFFYRFVRSVAFEASVLVLIFLSLFAMILETHFESGEMTDAMAIVNFFFIVIFFLEFVLKLIGLRWYYFKDIWNLLDFITIILSVVEICLEMSMPFEEDEKELMRMSPRIFRCIRLLRTGRSLRLIKAAKGIRVTFFFSLIWSLPAIFNIALLLFLVMFIYAIVGMFLFMRTEHSDNDKAINGLVNFETFRGSALLLLQAATAAGWDELLDGLRVGQRNCKYQKERGCGNEDLVTPFLVSYIVISFLVVMNLYVAVILEYFNQASTEVKQGLTNDDLEMFYETWERYDDQGTQYMPIAQLGDFVNRLEAPLRLPAPNRVQLVLLDVPIYRGNVVYCVEVLEALIKHFFGTTAREAEELGDLKRPRRTTFERESSTMRRQRESYSATVIQKAWRRQRSESAKKKKRKKNGDEENAEDVLLGKSSGMRYHL